MKYIVLIICLFTSTTLTAFGLGEYLPLKRMFVPQSGMYPTIDKGSIIFIKTGFLFSVSDVKRGRIVTFNHKIKGKEYVFLWRVIGVPGDSVITENNDVVLNGSPLKREKDSSLPDQEIYNEFIGEIGYRVSLNGHGKKAKRIETAIPEGYVFVMGDNRNNAMDSRFIGLVPISSIFGIKIP